MKVKELIEILEGCDAEASVFVMSQQTYPFEHCLAGVAVRGDFTDDGREDGDEAVLAPTADRWTTPDGKLPRNDVFLLEGSQVRYGSREAWDAKR
jgi:hypothetical protein